MYLSHLGIQIRLLATQSTFVTYLRINIFNICLIVRVIVLRCPPPELEDRDGEQKEAPIIYGKMVSDLLHQLDTQKSMRQDEIYPRV